MSYPTPETDVNRPVMAYNYSHTSKESCRLGSESLRRQHRYCSLGCIGYIDSNAGGRIQYPESIARPYVTVSEIPDVYPF